MKTEDIKEIARDALKQNGGGLNMVGDIVTLTINPDPQRLTANMPDSGIFTSQNAVRRG